MQNSAYKKLLNLKPFRISLKPFHISLVYLTLEKGFEVVKNIKILLFEEDWGKLLGKIYFFRQS